MKLFFTEFFLNCFLSERTFRNIWAVFGRTVFHYRCCLLQEWWRHSLCSCHLAPLCPSWHNVPFLCHQFILIRPRSWWNHDDKISKVFTGYFTMFIHVGHQGVQSVIFFPYLLNIYWFSLLGLVMLDVYYTFSKDWFFFVVWVTRIVTF